MRYAIARYLSQRTELAYRIYVTDSLHLMAQGKSLRDRFYDAIKPQRVETRDGVEIAHDVLSRAGVEVKTENADTI